MFGRVVEFQLLANASCFSGREGVIEGSRSMRIELIQHYPNHLGGRIILVDQPLHLVREVVFGSPLGDHQMTPARLRLTHHKEVGRPVALVFIINAGRLSGLRRQGPPGLGNQLDTLLIKVDLRTASLIGLSIEIQDILHTRDKLGPYVRNTPLLILPRFERGFFNNRRTLSCENSLHRPNSTARSANNRKVQRLRPPGAVLHATAITCATPLAVSLGRAPGRGRSLKAPSPSSTNRWRVRSMVATLVPTASAISSSVSCSSAFSRIWARVSFRPLLLPLRLRRSNSSRSAAGKSTWYFFIASSDSSSPASPQVYPVDLYPSTPV